VFVPRWRKWVHCEEGQVGLTQNELSLLLALWVHQRSPSAQVWEASCAMVVVAEYRGEEIQLEVTQPPGELPVLVCCLCELV